LVEPAAQSSARSPEALPVGKDIPEQGLIPALAIVLLTGLWPVHPNLLNRLAA
jgi:hypothetical protein